MPKTKRITRRKTRKTGGTRKMKNKSLRSRKTKKTTYRRRVGSGLCMGKMCRGQKNTNGANNANASNRTANVNTANRTANANTANRTINANTGNKIANSYRANNTARISTNMIRTNNGKANNSIPSVSSFDVPTKEELKANIQSIQRYYDGMIKDKISIISKYVEKNRATMLPTALAKFEPSTKPITAKYNETASISDRVLFITSKMVNLEREIQILSDNSNSKSYTSVQEKIMNLRDTIRSFSGDLDEYISKYNMNNVKRSNSVSMNNVKFN